MNQVIRDGPLLREVAGVPGREAGMTESQGDYLARSFGLAGRAALVTGGCGGLGMAICRALGRAGARVAVNGRSVQRCDEAVAALAAEGIAAVPAAFDVCDEAAVQGAAMQLAGAGFAVDTLVLNAGIQRRGPLVELPLAQWQALLDTHVTGAFQCVRAFLPAMLGRGYGRIVVMSSIAAHEAMPGIAAYATAKGALASFTRALAVEYGGQGINANALAPGFVRTPLTAGLQDNPEFGKFLASAVPQGRWGNSEDVAPVVAFLASPAAGFINGQVLAIDGGMLARM